MDDPASDRAALLRTVDQFTLINALIGGTRGRFVRHFFPLMDPSREYSLLDLGAGGCDIPRAIVRSARRRGLRLRVLALDRDSRIIPHARAASAAYPEIEVRQGEAAELPALGRFDFVLSNHLMHHLAPDELPGFIAAADAAAGLGLLLDDLLRSPWSWLAYSAFAGLLARRSFALEDGRLSILRGFRPEELEALRAAAAIPPATKVFRAFPGRLGYLRVGPGSGT
jgi:2-polyprenyl-3-methyl-5-hydroxy-6-metoxy-1,4-benzoquinol methylase